MQEQVPARQRKLLFSMSKHQLPPMLVALDQYVCQQSHDDVIGSDWTIADLVVYNLCLFFASSG